VIETLGSEYVQAARLNGLPEQRIIRRYALRNALAPSVQVFAVSIQALFGGVIVTEVLFSYPGLGAQLVNAVEGHDTTLVQGIALVIATFYILVNVIVVFGMRVLERRVAVPGFIGPQVQIPAGH